MTSKEVITQLEEVLSQRNTDVLSLISVVKEKGYATEAQILEKCLAKNEPDKKDITRMKALKTKSGKDQVKAVKLAKTQAKRIEDAAKAQRRAKAAKSAIKGKLGDAEAKIFQARYTWLRALES
jgi:hypothetical protein